MKTHGTRKHSKFSASGAVRWFNCPGSVELSEGMPDKESVWAKEGTAAHEVLEKVLKGELDDLKTDEMLWYAKNAARFIFYLKNEYKDAELLVETRIHLPFIHPDMFGTFDSAIIDHFGTLHVFDYKYGAGHAVSPKENLQMIFYGIGLAAKYDWNFSRVHLWIIQPRVKGYDGPLFWEMSITELKGYVLEFEEAVKRVEAYPDKYVEGSWCHWCKAKGVCPLKKEVKQRQTLSAFAHLITKE
jgi:hypothetical protein